MRDIAIDFYFIYYRSYYRARFKLIFEVIAVIYLKINKSVFVLDAIHSKMSYQCQNITYIYIYRQWIRSGLYLLELLLREG